MNQKDSLSRFLMRVRLYKDMEDASNLLPEGQVQQIIYSPQLNNFTRMSTIFDQEYVENGKITQNQAVNSPESKSKQINQNFLSR